ncbi:MAG: hypothetical protein RLZZ76_445 [Candidatus Parcubacteria bacterium]
MALETLGGYNLTYAQRKIPFRGFFFVLTDTL